MNLADDASGDLVARWCHGDQQAATELFRRYTDRLVALVRGRLSSKLGQRIDAEDVVQSVYRSFFPAARADRYDLQGEGNLWRLLVTITLNKLQHQVERHAAEKRSLQREQHYGSEDSLLALRPDLLSRDPTAVEAVALIDQLEHIMRRFDPVYRRVFELRLQGYSLDEIVADTRRSERTVYRILEEIKQYLRQCDGESSRL